MSSFSLIAIIVLLIIIVVLLVVVISILNKKDKPEKSKVEEEVVENKNVSLPNIKKVDFPPNIEKLSSHELQAIARKIYESYRCFDYKNMDEHDLDKKEWHTWQVSILLMVYKNDDEFFIPNQKEVFNNFLLESSPNSIKNVMKDLLDKYENYVDIFSGKDKLSKEYLWSDREVSIIFYFLTNYKNYK